MPKAKPKGRPSKYSELTANQICEHLAEGGSLRTFCLQEGAPSQSMVYRWLDQNEEFREQYARAREAQAETYADAIVDISDTEDDPQRARVRIDARKWTASKLQPKKYGDKVQTELTGKDGAPLMPESPPRDVARAVLDILREAKVEKGEADAA